MIELTEAEREAAEPVMAAAKAYALAYLADYLAGVPYGEPCPPDGDHIAALDVLEFTIVLALARERREAKDELATTIENLPHRRMLTEEMDEGDYTTVVLLSEIEDENEREIITAAARIAELEAALADCGSGDTV